MLELSVNLLTAASWLILVAMVAAPVSLGLLLMLYFRS